MLVKYAKEQKECWEDYLECCLFEYNTSKHESLKFTPFEVMFVRQAVLPIDVHYCTNTASLVHDQQLDNADEVEVRMLHQRQVLEVVKINIAAAQTRQKDQYDRKHYNPDVLNLYPLF